MTYHYPSRLEKLAPHVTLWMLRLLTLPTALRNFVRKDDFWVFRSNVTGHSGLS